MSDVTRILNSVNQGQAGAAEELLPLVYDELRKLAAHRMANEAPGQTLQATALVHEAWLRVAGNSGQQWNSKGHFFAAAAEAMRRILVEKARRKQALRHGGGRNRVGLEALECEHARDDDRLLRIHACLDELSRLDARQAEVVKLRYFVGLTLAEIAALQSVSEKTVQRDWNHAKAWLMDRIRSEP